MKNKGRFFGGMLCGLLISFMAGIGVEKAIADMPITLWLNGTQIQTDTAPIIVNDRTMVPIRVISEQLNLDVEWDGANRKVLLTGNVPEKNNKMEITPLPDLEQPVSELPSFEAVDVVVEESVIAANQEITQDDVPMATNPDIPQQIRGKSLATADQLQALAWSKNPEAPDIAKYYIELGEYYGIRGDVAFCQAAKETGWWNYGNLVKAYQNNYCGLGATGTAATGTENLNGADSQKVSYAEGVHGAIFATPRDGVEAQLQHLYAYCCSEALPAGTSIVDPRFTLVRRGVAVNWQDLNGRWAVPGDGYGESIIADYYAQAFDF